MIDLDKEREAFEKEWLKLGGDFKSYIIVEGMYVLKPNVTSAGDLFKELAERAINSAWALWLIQARKKQQKMEELRMSLDHANLVVEAAKEEISSLKNINHHLEEINDDFSESLKVLKENSKKIESGEFVVVPKECPDPEFSDALFEMFKPVCFGDVGDDAFVAVSDIDEQKVWDLMVKLAAGDGK